MIASSHLRRLLALLLLGFMLPVGAQPPGFEIRDGELVREDGLYYLELAFTLRLSAAAHEALDNGVPLVVRVDVEVERVRWWWWDERIASSERRFRLRYHALSDRYLITALGSGESRSFRTLSAVLAEFKNLRRLGLIEARRLQPGEHYVARARAALDLDALPRPLRAVAYISPSWRLASEWRSWSFDS